MALDIAWLAELTKENAKHIAVLNSEFGKISVDLAVLVERVDWIYKILWVIITASIGAFITNIWQLIKMHKK